MSDPNVVAVWAALAVLTHVVQVAYTFANIDRIHIKEINEFYTMAGSSMGPRLASFVFVVNGLVLAGLFATFVPQMNVIFFVVNVTALIISYRSVKAAKRKARDAGKAPKWE